MNTVQYRGDVREDGEIVPFRIAACDGVHPDAVSMMTQAGGIDLVDDPAEAQGLLIRSKTKLLQEDHLRRYRDLLYVARVGVGMDNVNLPLTAAAGIATVNTPGASTEPVARRALTLALAWSARAVQGSRALADGRWPKGERETEPIDLSEKTLGIVGFGRIGQALKRLAEPHFGRIQFSDLRDVPGKVDLDELLRSSDVISMHLSGTDPVLTRERSALLRPGTLVVNTARGEVVDTAALLDRMDDGVHAASDVFTVEGEAMFADPTIARLVKHPNFIGTPHTAASDAVTQKRLGQEGAQRMIAFAREGIVNPEDIPGHTLPRVLPNSPKAPCIRALLTHRSVPGVLGIITGIAGCAQVNIRQLVNEEGSHNGGAKLAATAVDLADTDPLTALDLIRRIEDALTVHRKRLITFA